MSQFNPTNNSAVVLTLTNNSLDTFTKSPITSLYIPKSTDSLSIYLFELTLC